MQAAEAQKSLVAAGASDGELTLAQRQVAVAAANVAQAAGNRSVVLEAAPPATIEAAQAALAAAEAELTDARLAYEPILQAETEDTGNASVRPGAAKDDSEREQAALRLDAARREVDAAQAELQKLLDGATAGQRQAASGAVGAAAGQRDAAQAQLALLSEGPSPEETAIAAANVNLATSTVREAERQIEQAMAGVAGAEAAVMEARAVVAAAQAALDDRTLSAPFAGTVASLRVDVGEVVVAGAPAVVLADFSSWRVETTDLLETLVVDVVEEALVAVTLDALPGATLSGRVLDVARAADVRRGDVTYTVEILLLDGGDLPLRWGMTAFVTF